MLNPFAFTRGYARLSNIFAAPLFAWLPVPRGYILLTTRGRKSGRERRRPVRAVRSNSTYYAVAILGERSDWLRNVRRDPGVEIKAGSRRESARARALADPAEREAVSTLYVDTVFPYDYLDHVNLHWGWPSRRKVVQAHRVWLARGELVAFDIAT
ncbi:MAG: nitroreductase/quinone reductase family protein [Dehalococcoidia bacterium]